MDSSTTFKLTGAKVSVSFFDMVCCTGIGRLALRHDSIDDRISYITIGYIMALAVTALTIIVATMTALIIILLYFSVLLYVNRHPRMGAGMSERICQSCAPL